MCETSTLTCKILLYVGVLILRYAHKFFDNSPLKQCKLTTLPFLVGCVQRLPEKQS